MYYVTVACTFLVSLCALMYAVYDYHQYHKKKRQITIDNSKSHNQASSCDTNVESTSDVEDSTDFVQDDYIQDTDNLISSNDDCFFDSSDLLVIQLYFICYLC